MMIRQFPGVDLLKYCTDYPLRACHSYFLGPKRLFENPSALERLGCVHILAGIIESTLCKQRKLLPKRSLNESIFIFVFIVTQAKRIPGANVSFGAKCLQTHFPKFGGIGLVPTNNVTETQDSGFLSRFQILGSGLILPCTLHMTCMAYIR